MPSSGHPGGWPTPPRSKLTPVVLGISLLRPAARWCELACQHQVPNVLLQELVVAVELVVFLLDGLNPVEEGNKRFLQRLGMPSRSCQLGCLSRSGRPNSLRLWAGNPCGPLVLTSVVLPAPLCRATRYPRSFSSGSWPGRRPARPASRRARQPTNREVQSWCRCSCGWGVVAARGWARELFDQATTLLMMMRPTSPGSLVLAGSRLPLWIMKPVTMALVGC